MFVWVEENGLFRLAESGLASKTSVDMISLVTCRTRGRKLHLHNVARAIPSDVNKLNGPNPSDLHKKCQYHAK